MDRVLCYALLFVVIFTSSCHGAYKISDGMLECTTTGLNVTFNKTLLDERQQEGNYKVYFMGNETLPGCFFDNNNGTNVYNDLMWLATAFTDCGVEVRNDNQNYYYNQTIMVKFGPDPVNNLVTRQEVDTYSVKCTVPWNITVNMDTATNFNVTLQKQVLTKSEESNYDVKLFRINPASLNFDSIIPDTSNSVSVGDKLSFAIVLTTVKTDVKLVKQDCYATNAADSSSSRYNLPNKCLYYEEKQDRFDIRAFKFYGESTAIYMTCNVLICAKSDDTGDCKSCTKRRRRREIVGLSDETGVAIKGSPKRATVTSGLIVILEEDKQKSDATSGEQRSTNFFQGTTGTIVLILIIALILIGIIVFAKKILAVPARSNTAHSNVSEETGHDNISFGKI